MIQTTGLTILTDVKTEANSSSYCSQVHWWAHVQTGYTLGREQMSSDVSKWNHVCSQTTVPESKYKKITRNCSCSWRSRNTP